MDHTYTSVCINWWNLNKICSLVNGIVRMSISCFWYCTIIMKDVIICRKLGEGYTGSRCCFFATFCESVNTLNVLTKLVLYQQYLRPLDVVVSSILFNVYPSFSKHDEFWFHHLVVLWPYTGLINPSWHLFSHFYNNSTYISHFKDWVNMCLEQYLAHNKHSKH